MTFQKLSSSLAITSLSLLSLIFLSPINFIEEIFVMFPLSSSIIKSRLFSSILFILVSILLLL